MSEAAAKPGFPAMSIEQAHALVDFHAARDRALPTTLYGTAGPLVVWAHGMWGHPRKFTHLLGRWAEA